MLLLIVSVCAKIYHIAYYTKCGDNTRDSWETCDHGNASKNDGCDGLCYVESGWSCDLRPAGTPDVCKDICADGLNYTPSATYCDDGNTTPGDG